MTRSGLRLARWGVIGALVLVGASAVPAPALFAARAAAWSAEAVANDPASDQAASKPKPADTKGTRGAADTPGLPPTWMWWQDVEVKRELVLSDEKAQKIDDLFQSRQKLLLPMAADFLKAKTELDRMTAERTADDGTYSLQVWRVESLRSKLNESRLMMLYRIYRELQPDQYKKLQAISDRYWDRLRNSGSGR